MRWQRLVGHIILIMNFYICVIQLETVDSDRKEVAGVVGEAF